MEQNGKPKDIILDDFIANLNRATHEGTKYIPFKESAIALSMRYPYFASPMALLLQGDKLTADEERSLRLKIAVLTADRNLLFRLTDELGKEFENFYPEKEEEEISTDQAIDTFLSEYGTPDPKEDAILEKLIFNPVPDYSQILIREEQGAGRESASEKETGENKQTGPQAPSDSQIKSSESAPNPESLLSESLAKIYIKQQRYDKAYEIISNLNLNFPEKSRYFADQLRFLRKLIYINSKK